MISIIIPVYNGEKYLRKCLDSVTGQSFQDVEILIVNDGSKDRSQQILEEYAARDTRIQLICQENKGVSAARNAGLDRARGEYIFFFDCDDVLMNDALKALHAAALSTGADLVIGNYKYLHQATGELQTPGQWVRSCVFSGSEILQCCHLTCLPPNKLWKRSLIEEHGIRMYDLKMGEDLSFFLRVLTRCQKVATVEDCIFHYRIYDGSSSYSYNMNAVQYIDAFDLIEKDYRELGDREDFTRELMYDRLFYYVGTLKRLPRYRKKENRRDLLDAYIEAGKRLDLRAYENRPDIMDLWNQLQKFEKYRFVYESELYTISYQLARKAKHILKRLLHQRKRG